MSKYKTKLQLLDEIKKEKFKLDVTLAALSDQQKCTTLICEEWTTKDVIFHLARWQEMVLTWYKEGVNGNTPSIPHEKYKWSQLPDLNHEIYLNYKDLSLKESLAYFAKNESEITELLKTLDEETLLKPGLYPWMKNNALIAYLGSCTSSHYKWANDLVKKGIKK